MKYANRLTDEEILTFVNNVLCNEVAYFYGKKVEFKSYRAYLSIASRDEDCIVINSNYNLGLCCYNIFTIDDKSFTSLYPTCIPNEKYTKVLQSILANKYPEYKNDMEKK